MVAKKKEVTEVKPKRTRKPKIQKPLDVPQAPPTLSRLPDDIPVRVMEEKDYLELMLLSAQRESALLRRTNLEKEYRINTLEATKAEEYDTYRIMARLQKLEEQIASMRDQERKEVLIKEFDLERREIDLLKREVAHIRKVLLPSIESSVIREQAVFDAIDKRFKDRYTTLTAKYKIDGEFAIDPNTLVIMDTKRTL